MNQPMRGRFSRSHLFREFCAKPYLQPDPMTSVGRPAPGQLRTRAAGRHSRCLVSEICLRLEYHSGRRRQPCHSGCHPLSVLRLHRQQRATGADLTEITNLSRTYGDSDFVSQGGRTRGWRVRRSFLMSGLSGCSRIPWPHLSHRMVSAGSHDQGSSDQRTIR